MSKAIILQGDDWEGLYVDGKLIEEGHTLNQGYSRIKYLSQLAKKYKFALDDVKEQYLEDEDLEWMAEECLSGFPEYISEFRYKYPTEDYGE